MIDLTNFIRIDFGITLESEFLPNSTSKQVCEVRFEPIYILRFGHIFSQCDL